jgi:Hexokinase
VAEAPAVCLHLGMGVRMIPLQLSVLLVKQGKDAPVVGFCFSFPVDQTTVNSGRIIVWTKGAPMCPA